MFFFEITVCHNSIVVFQVTEKAVLDDEPVVGSGVAAALLLANKKGIGLEKVSFHHQETISKYQTLNFFFWQMTKHI